LLAGKRKAMDANTEIQQPDLAGQVVKLSTELGEARLTIQALRDQNILLTASQKDFNARLSSGIRAAITKHGIRASAIEADLLSDSKMNATQRALAAKGAA
jgi:hypothetical protein